MTDEQKYCYGTIVSRAADQLRGQYVYPVISNYFPYTITLVVLYPDTKFCFLF